MKRRWLTVGIIVGLIILLAACAPKGEPASQPVQTATTLAPASPMPAGAVASPEETAWAKVVEAAKKEGTITAYTYSWVGEIGLAAKRTFENRYGIKLEILTGMQSEFQERLKTERRIGQVLGDMTEGSAANTESMKMDGLLTTVAADLPVFREKDVWLVDPAYMDPVDKINLGWRQSINSPWINTNLVKPGKEPQTWKDLLDPTWKGKLSLREPKLNGSLFAIFVALLDKKVWDEDYMKALHKQGLRYVINPMEESRLLGAGDIDLSVINSDSSGGPFVEKGAPLRAVSMNQGDIAMLASIAAIAKGPHPNATKVLLNWLLSQEGQSVMGKAENNLMVRKDVSDFRQSATKTKMLNPIFVTPAHLAEGTKRFRERWYDNLIGR